MPILQWFNLLLLHIAVYTGQVTLAMSMDVLQWESLHRVKTMLRTYTYQTANIASSDASET